MSRSAVEILSELVRVVRRIERESADTAKRAGMVAAVLERMSKPGQDKGPAPIAAPGAS
jgi:hypothetical protein